MDPYSIGLGLGGSIVQGLMGQKAQKDANRANIKLWEYQTQYNSPVSQMERLKNAGLNPNLVYGQVADSKMATAPTMEAAPTPLSNIQNLGMYQDIKNQSAQNDVYQAQKKEIEARAAGQALENVYKRYENRTLMTGGALRGDLPWMKLLGRGVDSLKKIGEYVGMKTEDSRSGLTGPELAKAKYLMQLHPEWRR